MERNTKLLILAIIVAMPLILYSPAKAFILPPASCIDGTFAITTPANFYPSDSAVCRDAASYANWAIIYEIPLGLCTQGVISIARLANRQTELWDGMYFIPSPGYPLAGSPDYVRFSLVMWDDYQIPWLGDTQMEVKTYTSDGSIFQINTATPFRVSNETSTGLTFPVHDYSIEVDIPNGGYIKMKPLLPGPHTMSDPYWILYGLQVLTAHDVGSLTFPCTIGDVATPTPGMTPTGTQTPTPTLAGTQAPATVTATPSPTPYEFITVTPQNTPSPISPITISTIAFPTVYVPTAIPIGTSPSVSGTLGVNPTVEANLTMVSEWVSDTNASVDSWITNTNLAMGIASGVDITNTMGVTSVRGAAIEMTENITLPISYAKLIQEIAPNLWPLIFFLILATAWVFFNLFVKWGIALLAAVINIIRILLSFIPGLGF